MQHKRPHYLQFTCGQSQPRFLSGEFNQLPTFAVKPFSPVVVSDPCLGIFGSWMKGTVVHSRHQLSVRSPVGRCLHLHHSAFSLPGTGRPAGDNGAWVPPSAGSDKPLPKCLPWSILARLILVVPCRRGLLSVEVVGTGTWGTNPLLAPLYNSPPL